MNLLEVIKKSDGFFEGHTVFKNGQHGNGWLEKGNIFKNWEYFEVFIKEQSERIAKKFPDSDYLVGAKICGSILVSHVAKLLNKDFCSTYNPEGKFIFHRFNVPKPGSKVVIIDDLIFTGSDMKEILTMFKEYDIETLGISAWSNRGSSFIEGVEIDTLFDAPFENKPEGECELCDKNVKISYANIRE